MDSPSPNSQVQPTLHIGNLASKTTVSELQALLSIISNPTRIVLRTRDDKASAYAFVTFSNVEDCEKVINEFNYYSLHNKQMNIIMFNEDKSFPADANLFVKNLPADLNSKDLNEIFKMFGQIVSCKVASNGKGELKGYGFVHYKNSRSAKRAMANCQNVKIGNHLVEVEIYNPKIRELKATKDTPVACFTNCYIKNFPRSMTESGLKEILEQCGKINSLYFPLKEDGAPVGYACANFCGPEDAIKAIEKLHGKYIFPEEKHEENDNIVSLPFYIQKAENKKVRADTIQRQLEMMGLDGQRAKSNLYVSNIPESFSKEEIKNIFLKFGQITDFKIVSSGIGTSKQYGYVCYATPEEAAVAYERIDGTFLDGNKLQISFYKNKAERIVDGNGIQLNSISGGSSSMTPLVFLDSEGANVDGPRRKILQVLYNSLLSKAESFSMQWEDLKVENVTEFAQRITLSMIDLPQSILKEMFNKEDSLNDYIKKTIKNKAIVQCQAKTTSKMNNN